MEKHARAGVLAVGLAAYWPQFEGMRDQVVGHYGTLLEKFGDDVELVDAGLVDSVDKARSAAAAFRAGDVDIVFCHLTTYATSEPLMLAVSGLDVPVILLNVQSVPSLDLPNVAGIGQWLGTGISCAALPEMTATLLRNGKRYDCVTGYLNCDAVVDEALAGWCRVASIRRTLHTKSIGLLGRPYPGMTDLLVDETALFAQLGAYVKHLNWDDISDALPLVSDGERASRHQAIVDTFDVPPDLPPSALNDAAGVLAAFDRVVGTHQLSSIASHYEGAVLPQHATALAASNPAFSILMRDGIACPVEGDIKAAVAMIVLKHLAGAATLAEFYSMDFPNDLLILGHSGAADVSVGRRKPLLKSSAIFHGKSGGGFLTQTYPQPGPMTLLSMTQSADGQFYFVAAEGEIVDGPSMELGDSNWRGRFTLGLRGFVNAWAAEGPTHHAAMAPGRHVDQLANAAKLLNLPLRIVCR